MKIVIDTFGADSKPEILICGALKSVAEQKEFDLILVTDPELADRVIKEEARKLGLTAEQIYQRVSVLSATAYVTNKDDPRCVIKEKTDSSMVLAFKALKEDDVYAMITAGATGCALVASCFHLGLKKGLLQPALCSMLLCQNNKWVCLCDCGSNLNPKVKDMADYAVMGAEFASSFYSTGKKREGLPKVGLINVGKESGKGTDFLREVYAKLSECSGTDFEFYGNIEGGDILNGEVDVAICDGFTGNVILKGLEKAGNICAQIAGQEGSPLISEKIKETFDYNNLAGAVFLGTKKAVIKAHGAANEKTIKSCIDQAIRLNRGGYLNSEEK